jgi:hypothetical protein
VLDWKDPPITRRRPLLEASYPFFPSSVLPDT